MKFYYKFFALSIISTYTVIAQITNPDFIKVEAAYKIGEYKKAKSLNDAVLQKKNSPSAYFHAAIIHNQLGNYKEIFPSIFSGLEKAQTYDKKSDNYISALAEASEAFAECGYPKMALKYSKMADSLYKLNQMTSVVLQYKVKSSLGIAQFKSGYYKDAIKTLTPIISTIGNIIFNDIRNPDTGKKLTKFELQILKQNYARIMDFVAQTYFESGNYDAADSLYNLADEWIKNNLGSKANERVINKLHMAKFNSLLTYDYVNGLKETGKALKTNNKTWFDKGKSLCPQSKEIVELNTDMYKYYLAGKDFGSAQKYQKAIISAMNKQYGNKSRNYFYFKNKTDAEYYTGRLMIKEAQASLDNLLSDSLMLSSMHPRRLEALNMMYQFKLNTGQVSKKSSKGDDFSVALIEKVKVSKYLFGAQSPMHQFDMLDYANYLSRYAYKFSEADKIYQESLIKILKSQLEPTSVVLPVLINEMGNHNELTEKYSEAFDNYALSADMYFKTLGDNSDAFADQLEKMANVQFASGYFKDAEKTIDKAITTFDLLKNPNRELYMNALVTKAQIKNAVGEFDEAKKSLRKTIKLSEKLDLVSADIEDEALESRAYILLEQGKYKEAESMLKSGIETKTETLNDGSIEFIKPYLNVGYIQFIYGNYAEAENYYNKALQISLKVFGPQSIRTAECYYKIQKLKYAIGDYDKAKELLLKVIDIYKNKFEEKHIFIVSAYLDLSNLYLVTKEPAEKSDELLSKALEIVTTYLGEEHSLYAQTVKDIAKFYIKTGQYDKAEKYLNISAAIFKVKQGRKNLNIAEIYVLKGDLNLQNKKLKDAETNYEKALNIYGLALSKEHPSYVSTQSKLAKVYYLDGKMKKSISLTDETTEKYMNFIGKYFPSLSEKEKLKFWNLIREDFEFYNFLMLKNYKQDPSLATKAFNHSLVTKSVLLNNSIKLKESILSSGDQELIANYNTYLSLKEQLTLALGLTDEEKESQGINIKNLESDISNLEKELGKKSEFFTSSVKSKRNTWLDVKEILGEKETAVEMLRVRYFNGQFTDSVIYASLTINKKTQTAPEVTVLANGTELETRMVKYYRNQIKFKYEDEESFQAYWDPIYARIPKGNLVYFSPEGVYNQINLETLRLPDGTYVLDNQDISIVSNFSSLIETKKRKPVKNNSNLIFVIGNPRFYDSGETGSKQSIQQLPGTELEAQTISDLFDKNQWEVVTNLDTSASENKVKTYQNPRIVHIATHGFFKEIDQKDFEIFNEELTSPLNRSGILLKYSGNILSDDKSLNFNSKDGILTASEAMNLYMDKTELVVLSACETGLGQVQAGEGVYGLQRSFLVAGAGSVVMSLFKVDDEATKLLMIEFYKNWLKTGNKRKAFTDAKRTIKKIKPQPIYWGAFVMVENK
ncbi:MAG: CHAT domain-containing tetratricopeptide repeat protein [Bacteroidota bacterium]|nr:CHAT domain-containing tetratricopeptide repeat protein [Bacteroidota bacterium]